jgi:hypothetical protein
LKIESMIDTSSALLACLLKPGEKLARFASFLPSMQEYEMAPKRRRLQG